MKKILILGVILYFLALNAPGAGAQTKVPDFSGDWIVDMSHSSLPVSGREMKYMVLNVVQTETEFQAGYAAMKKNLEPGEARPVPHIFTAYSLDGKQTTAESPMPEVVGPSTLTAKFDKSRLILTIDRKVKGPAGWIQSRTREIWQLSSDNKTLKISREMGSGAQSILESLVCHRPETAEKPAGN